jgi:hypothetical protein
MKKVISATKLYRLWEGMKARCYNENRKEYINYGGRGIIVCNSWLKFENFKKWALSNGYEIGLELDRKDNDRNYEPKNCAFVTHSKNNLNKRKRKDNTTGYTGVTFHIINFVYNYEIQIDGKRTRKSGFKTAKEAFEAKNNYIKENGIYYENK